MRSLQWYKRGAAYQEGTVLSAHRTQAEIGGLVIGFAGFLLYG